MPISSFLLHSRSCTDTLLLPVVKTPSCLWRRTGEIVKANAEFARLVDVDQEWLRDGKVGIYELMKEESAVNFWEQYFQGAWSLPPAVIPVR